MKTWAVVLLVILAILIVAVVVLYFLGRKMQKKQEIKRLEKGHKPKKEDLFEGLDGELLEEIKDLLKD